MSDTSNPTCEPITSFSGDYAFLSNFWVDPHPVAYSHPRFPTLQPVPYETSEHAYQAAKATNRADHDRVASAKGPGAAKRAGRRIDVWADWDVIRVPVMTDIIAAKFAAGSELAAKLLATGDAQLIEGNYWGDTFWGVCNGRGSNMLGVILMARRAQLRENTEVFNLKAAYDEALGESNAAGFVGFTPAQTIKAQSLMTMRACPKCAGVGTVPVLVGGGPDAHDEDVTCPLCNGTCVVNAVVKIPANPADYDALIRRVFMDNGFTVKEGQTDLKAYVFAAARALVDKLTGVEMPR